MKNNVLFDRKIHPYELAGHKFGIRELNARAASKLAQMLFDSQKPDAGVNFYDVQVEYVRQCLTDENGTRVFLDDDDLVYDMNNTVLTDIAEQAMKINKRDPGEAEKN